MKHSMAAFVVGFMVALGSIRSSQLPDASRPKAIDNPSEKVGATGMKVQPPDTLPNSRAPLPTPKRKAKLAQKASRPCATATSFC